MKFVRVGGGLYFLTFLLSLSAQIANGGVLINEIMYNPGSGNLLESYVELLNTDTNSIDLSGWRFTKGISYTFSANTILASGAYLVVAADSAAFTSKYPGIGNFVAGFTGAIGSDVRLEN